MTADNTNPRTRILVVANETAASRTLANRHRAGAGG